MTRPRYRLAYRPWGGDVQLGPQPQTYGGARAARPGVSRRVGVAGGPTPDIYRFWGHKMGPAPQGYAPALQGGAVNIAGGPTPDI
eukprot:gene21261-biopygen16171